MIAIAVLIAAVTVSARQPCVATPGEPRAVVIVPGLLGGGFGFRHVTAALTSAGHRVVVLEPLGYGSAARPAGADYTLAAQAARVASAMDSLALCDALLVAHSLGAGIAMRVAAARPDLVNGLLAVEGGGAESALGPGARSVLTLAPIVRFASRGMIRSQVRRQILSQAVRTDWLTDAVLQEYVAPVAADFGATLRAMTAMSRAVEPRTLAEQLAAVRASVTVLSSGPPGITTIPDAELATMRAKLRSVEVRVIGGSGHFIHEENPRAVIAAALELIGGPAVALSTVKPR